MVTAEHPDYTLTSTLTMPIAIPPSRSDVDFIGHSKLLYTITGQIHDILGKGLVGASVYYGAAQTSTMDVDEHMVFSTDGGVFIIRDLPPGSYYLSLAMRGYVFTPGLRIVSVPPNAERQFFVGIKEVVVLYTVAGKVLDENGNPLGGVLMALNGEYTAVTDRYGNYTIRGVPQGTYNLTAARVGYSFIPAGRAVDVPRQSTNQDFTAHRLR